MFEYGLLLDEFVGNSMPWVLQAHFFSDLVLQHIRNRGMFDFIGWPIDIDAFNIYRVSISLDHVIVLWKEKSEILRALLLVEFGLRFDSLDPLPQDLDFWWSCWPLKLHLSDVEILKNIGNRILQKDNPLH
jgi:hypothetical protein